MAAEGAVVGDVLTLLKRLDAAVASKTAGDVVDVLTALEAQPISVPVLTKTRCGVTVAKLRAHEHADAAAKAGALVLKWKKVAEEAGIAVRRSVSAGSAESAGTPTTPAASTAPAPPAAAAAASSGSSSSSSSAGASSSPAGVEGGPASPLPPPKAYEKTGLMSVALPPARAGPRKILGDKIGAVVKEQLLLAQSASAASAAAGVVGSEATLPPPSADDIAAQAADVGAALESELFSAYGHPDPTKPGGTYAEHFKMLAMGLPRNPPLVLNLFSGALPVAELARFSSDDLVSDEARKNAEAVRTHQ